MIKKIAAHPVWSSVIAGVILTVLGSVGSYLAGWWPSVQTWLISGAQQFWDLLTTRYASPGWFILLLMASWAFGCFILIRLLYRRYTMPHWRDYRQETFFGVVWRWRYDRADNIEVLRGFCPRCDTQVYPRGYLSSGSGYYPNRTIYHCDHCDNRITLDGAESVILEKVVIEIERRLRTGLWQVAVTPGRGKGRATR